SGSVRQAGSRVRLTAQLVNGASGRYMWSESVDTDQGDLFNGQEQVAQRIVTRLEPELTQRGRPAAAPAPTENLAAQNLYLQGRYHLNQRTEEGLLKGLEFFEKALI